MDTGLDSKEVTAKWYEANLQILRDLGLYAVKTLVTLNSGSIVVMLTFLGNSASQTQYKIDLESIRLSMYLFLAGISVAALVVAFSYVVSFVASPYRTDKGVSNWVALAIYISLCVMSFISFVAGVCVVIGGVDN